MMRTITVVLLLGFIAVFLGCSDSTSVETTQFKGSIYYSNGGTVYKLNVTDQSKTELFTNARHPDVTNSGDIICVETYPMVRIMRTDLTGANRNNVLTGVDYTGPKYRQYMNKPRISYNQQYVVYEGDNVSNPNTYVVNATDGTLIATIGDYSKSQPMITPSWAPDGSIVVQGWTSLNNGIYKVSPDFTSMQRIDPNLTNVSEPSVSPDGKTIAFIRDGQLWIMGIDGSNATQLYAGGNYRFGMPTWSPDSKYIATVNNLASSGHIHILDVQAKTLTEITKSHYVSPDHQLCWRY
ncbi:MAG: PD40 domain-containing protein [Candidatus Kapabacteria bacterium]|nr:PD40 domain-containing protein [Candidatus Kapabacteria bacterium]